MERTTIAGEQAFKGIKMTQVKGFSVLDMGETINNVENFTDTLPKNIRKKSNQSGGELHYGI